MQYVSGIAVGYARSRDREARALLLARHDGELAARERQAAALVEALPHDERAQQRNDYERKLATQ